MGGFRFLPGTIPKDNYASRLQITDQELSPNRYRKFSTLSNKADVRSLEGLVLVWPSAERSSKRTRGLSLPKAVAGTKDPHLPSLFRRAKKLSSKLRRPLHPRSRRVRSSVSCLSKIMKIRTGR